MSDSRQIAPALLDYGLWFVQMLVGKNKCLVSN